MSLIKTFLPENQVVVLSPIDIFINFELAYFNHLYTSQHYHPPGIYIPALPTIYSAPNTQQARHSYMC